MAAERETPSPAEQVARIYEQAEAEAAKTSERLVGSGGFTSLLGLFAENAAALTRLGNDALDLTLRNLRLAGRRDIVRLSRQLARTEDKLERVLQEIEAVRDRLDREADPHPLRPRAAADRGSTPKAGANGRAGRRAATRTPRS